MLGLEHVKHFGAAQFRFHKSAARILSRLLSALEDARLFRATSLIQHSTLLRALVSKSGGGITA
jgi:hypothetical protein